MQSLDAFLSRLIPKVPGCLDPLARQALVDAAIEFCEETSIVQFTSEPQNIVALQGIYDVDVPDQQMVAVTLKTWYGTTQLRPAPANKVDTILAYVNAAGTDMADTGTPSTFYEFAPGSIGLYPVPNQALALGFSARIATKPIRGAVALDDVLYQDWIEGVVAGAASRLCAMQGQAFTNPVTAQEDRAKFWSDISKATNTAQRGRIRTSMRIRQRSFA